MASNCIPRTLWLDKPLLRPTSPSLAGGTPSLTTYLDRCFRTGDRRGSPWGRLSSRGVGAGVITWSGSVETHTHTQVPLPGNLDRMKWR